MPPKNGGYSDKIAAITDEKLYQVKEVIKFLPLVEQDLLAGNLLNFLNFLNLKHFVSYII
jgi:hypothetical protein